MTLVYCLQVIKLLDESPWGEGIQIKSFICSGAKAFCENMPTKVGLIMDDTGPVAVKVLHEAVHVPDDLSDHRFRERIFWVVCCRSDVFPVPLPVFSCGNHMLNEPREIVEKRNPVKQNAVKNSELLASSLFRDQ